MLDDLRKMFASDSLAAVNDVVERLAQIIILYEVYDIREGYTKKMFVDTIAEIIKSTEERQ
jgi:hypothetical protein